jgi:hypothetical protein
MLPRPSHNAWNHPLPRHTLGGVSCASHMTRRKTGMPMLSQAVRCFVSPVSFGRVIQPYGARLTQGIYMGLLGGCGLLLAVTVGCLKPTLQSDTIDVVRQPELVAHCTLITEGTYTAVGETNTLTLAKNATAENGGNVLLITSMTKRDTFTTEVHGWIYACPRTR